MPASGIKTSGGQVVYVDPYRVPPGAGRGR